MPIKIYNRYGDPRKQAAADIELAKRVGATQDDTPHGLHPSQIEAMERRDMSMAGGLASKQRFTRSAVQDMLPEGRSLDVRTPRSKRAQLFQSPSGMGGGNGASVFTTMQNYQPEFASPDRQMFPIHRRLANSYWRLFYKMDPVIGSVIEMFSDLPWSDFQITGEGVDGEIKEAFEHMVRETKLSSMLPYFVREFLVVGEVIPHLYWDDDKGIWSHIALHNPDQINVVYSPFVKMDTVMEFVPDDRLRELATSTHPMLSRVRETMPAELVSALRAGQNIPLSPVNASFIGRKLHPYEIRGTSIISRLWRTLMLEDAVWSATIQTARRAAAPLKVAKLGDPATGTMVGPQEEKRLLSLLAQAENDPQAWLVWNHQVQFEMAGAPERIMSINTHYEIIERIKLVALGVSKSFISGETSYSSAASGLTVFLQRLKAMRDFFVNEWLIPKFFLPVAQMNEWVKPQKAQSSKGHLRVKRSSQELLEENMYIVPTIEWSKSLDAQVDQERIEAMQALEQGLGIKISDQKKYASMGLDAEEEQTQIVEEVKFKKELAGNDPLLQAAIGLLPPNPEGGGGPMGGGGMMSPGIPGDAFGMPGGDPSMGAPGGGMGAPGGAPGGDMGAPPPDPAGASVSADEGAQPKPPSKPTSSAHWAESTLAPLMRVFESFDASDFDADEEPWSSFMQRDDAQAALDARDRMLLWESVEQFLLDENYPSVMLTELAAILAAHGMMKAAGVTSPDQFDHLLTQVGITPEQTSSLDTLVREPDKTPTVKKPKRAKRKKP